MKGISTRPQKPLTKFHLFPNLPTELRLKIYDSIFSLPSPHRRILKIAYSPSLASYTSSTPPPGNGLLHLSHESRSYASTHYVPLLLGPTAKSPAPLTTRILISFETDTLYLSSLHPLLGTHLHDILFHLSTSPSRHAIQSLAIDLRVWSELCENGFLGVLARMNGLKEVLLVVEFGRVGCFRGELEWLEVPGWRGDLFWLAERAERVLGEERDRVWGRGLKGKVEENDERVRVRCVLLTRGGEQV